MSTTYNGNKFTLILILGLLTTIGPLAIDLYLPAFPEISVKLATERVSLSLSSFFIGLAVGQLIYGPILERFGRKYPIYTGLTLFALASFGCALSQNIEQLIVFRFLQAIGSCAGLVSARTIVRDLFDTKETARIFSMLIMVVAVSPILAPTLGSFIYQSFGWRAIFIALIILALLLLVGTIMVLPHTKPVDPSYSLSFPNIFRNYYRILKDPHFHIYAFTAALPYGGLYAYLSTASHLYLETFGLTEHQFGYVFAIIASGLISSSQINRFVLRKRASENIIPRVLTVQCTVATIFTIVVFTSDLNMVLTTFFIFGYMSCIGFIFPNASALSLKNMGHTAGNASALMGAVQMIWGGIISGIVSMLLNNSIWPMTTAMLFCSALALCVFYYGKYKFKKE